MPEDKTLEPAVETISEATEPAVDKPASSSEQEEKGPEHGTVSTPETEPAADGPALPPLSPHEFRIYNRLAEQMDYFHDHFRQTWTTLYTACTTNRRPANLTLKQFLDEGLRLARYLETHHTIEETHLYPLLARKMPEFRAASPSSSSSSSSSSSGPKGKGSSSSKRGGQDCELLRQHKAIHVGMDEFADYLRRCKARECEFEMGVLKEKMDSWGAVLFKHLDQEVRDLGAENMRKYWTLAEMRAFPI